MDPKAQKKPRGKPKKAKTEEVIQEPTVEVVEEPIVEVEEEIIVEESEEESNAEPKIEDSNTNIVEEAKLEVEPEAKLEVEPEINLETKLEVEPETKPEINLEIKLEVDKTDFEIKSLLNLLIIISVRPEMQKKYNVTPEINKLISLILQEHSDFFSKIEISLKKIVEDNKIDSSDVPELMSLFSSVYELMQNLKFSKDTIELSNICGELIKLIFSIMITEKLINIELNNVQACFNALVDSSISLIKLSKSVKLGKGCCCVIC